MSCKTANSPIHALIESNQLEKIEDALRDSPESVEARNGQDLTPLQLAVALNREAIVSLLLSFDANVLAASPTSWTVVDEAVASGNSSTLTKLLRKADQQYTDCMIKSTSRAMKKLSQSEDFYVEMRWEFTSWLPVVSQTMPVNVCAIWKKDALLRVDSNLMSFNGSSPYLRGFATYIFDFSEPSTAFMDVYDHTSHTRQRYPLVHESGAEGYASGSNAGTGDKSDDFVNFAAMLQKQPIFATYLEKEKIGLSKSRSLRGPQLETVCGHQCSVCVARDVQLVTLRRTEHLQPDGGCAPQAGGEMQRKKVVTTKVKTFKPHFWLCKDLHNFFEEKIRPVLEIMSNISPFFRRLCYLLDMEHIEGLPVKFEVPLYHVFCANINFTNICGKNGVVDGIETGIDSSQSDKSNDSSASLLANKGDQTCGKIPRCSVRSEIFKKYDDYCPLNEQPSLMLALYKDEHEIQTAVHCSIASYGGPKELSERQYSLSQHKVVDCEQRVDVDAEERMMQEAIASSLSLAEQAGVRPPGISDDEYNRVLEASRRNHEDDQKLQEKEREELARVMKLSLVEK